MSEKSEYILKVTNIKKSFGGVKALDGVNLAIKKGEIHSLAGENGCGKSTLIKIISGFYTADEGIIELNGNPYQKLTPVEAIQQGVQIIYQDFSIFPNMTVMENIAMNMELMDKRKLVNYRRMREIAEEAVSRIQFKVDLEERVENLSIADRQLIAISRALINNAKIIIMDEPTTSLTEKEVKALFDVIKNLQAGGMTVLFVSHKLDEVFEISEKFTILRNGKNVISGNTSDLDSQKFAFYMTGREFHEELFVPDKVGEKPVLEVENLCLKDVFSDISFALRKGEILGITGLLGSGRNELVMSMFGIYPANKGKIRINGEPVRIRTVRDAVRNGIGYVPADRLTEGLFLSQSIKRNIISSTFDKFCNKAGFLQEKAVDDEVGRWITELSVKAADSEVAVRTLSGGNQQKVVLARWLAADLSVLILNGPTVGVDIGAKFDIHAILRSLARKGLGIIIISDDLPEILYNCNRVLIIANGRIVKEVQTNQTTEDQLAAMVADESLAGGAQVAQG